MAPPWAASLPLPNSYMGIGRQNKTRFHGRYALRATRDPSPRSGEGYVCTPRTLRPRCILAQPIRVLWPHREILFLRGGLMLSQSASAGLGRQRAEGSDAPSVPEAFLQKAVHVHVWDRAGGHTSGPRLLTPVPRLGPALVTGEPPFAARHSSRRRLAHGNAYGADLKEQFRASAEQLNCS